MSRGTVINFDQAEKSVQDLVRESALAREKAYAPFSNFKVGAAILCKDQTFRGCNVENSTYGATICAERTACTKAVSEGYTEFIAIAVCAEKSLDAFTTPCGICRQFLFEFSSDFKVYCAGPDLKEILVTSIDELLPFGFRFKPPYAKPQL